MRVGYEWEAVGSLSATLIQRSSSPSLRSATTLCPPLPAHYSTADGNWIKTSFGGGGGSGPRRRNRHQSRHQQNNHQTSKHLDQSQDRHRPSGAATSPTAAPQRVGFAELPLATSSATPSLTAWKVERRQHQGDHYQVQHSHVVVDVEPSLSASSISDVGAAACCQLPNPQFCTLHLLQSTSLMRPRRVKTWLPLSICSVYNSASNGTNTTDCNRSVTFTLSV